MVYYVIINEFSNVLYRKMYFNVICGILSRPSNGAHYLRERRRRHSADGHRRERVSTGGPPHQQRHQV